MCLCCCPNINIKILVIVLLVFASLIFISSFIISFFMAYKTEQYKTSIDILDLSLDPFFKLFLPSACFEEPDKYAGYLYDGPDRCYLDGEKYAQQRKEITFQSIYRSLQDIELAFNILRVIISFLYLGSLIFIFIKILNKINVNSIIEKLLSFLYIFIIIVPIIILIISILYLYFIALANGTFNEIGLYKLSDNEFINHVAAQMSINIVNMAFSIVCIILSATLMQANKKDSNQQQSNEPNTVQYNNDQNQDNHGRTPRRNSRGSSPIDRPITLIQTEERQNQRNPK